MFLREPRLPKNNRNDWVTTTWVVLLAVLVGRVSEYRVAAASVWERRYLNCSYCHSYALRTTEQLHASSLR